MNGILDWVRQNAVIVNLLTFGLGLWLGNRLSIGRDKRVEWNELTLERYRDLLSVIEGGHSDLTLITEAMPFYRRAGFKRALACYLEAQKAAQGNYIPETGGVTPVSAEKKAAVHHAAVRLLRYYRRR